MKPLYSYFKNFYYYKNLTFQFFKKFLEFIHGFFEIKVRFFTRKKFSIFSNTVAVNEMYSTGFFEITYF